MKPFPLFSRNSAANTISAAFMHIPVAALIHIQKIAPAPPIDIAPATPAMFPVPTVAEREVQAALKEPNSSLFLHLNAAIINFTESPNRVI